MKKPIEGAKNILKEGLKIISSGTGDYTDGDGVRSSDTQLSMKSEAQPISFAVGGVVHSNDPFLRRLIFFMSKRFVFLSLFLFS